MSIWSDSIAAHLERARELLRHEEQTFERVKAASCHLRSALTCMLAEAEAEAAAAASDLEEEARMLRLCVERGWTATKLESGNWGVSAPASVTVASTLKLCVEAAEKYAEEYAAERAKVTP